MESNDKLKEIDIKDCTCYYLNDNCYAPISNDCPNL